MTQNANHPIYVTKPFLPPKDELKAYIDTIWDNGILTNGGPLVAELEQKLATFLDVPFVNLFNNCTIALMAALPCLDVTKGEVITTPYTFMATAHSILWNHLTPVFVDIDPQTMNIAPQAILSAITPQTKAILAVHCYGRPCDTQAIKTIADHHNIKVIYDAAHAFHVRDGGGSILRHGDLSVLSFHATKVFNTFEGGAIISHSKDMFDTIKRFQNFGINGETDIDTIGINGKQSEIHAAMGLVMLPYIDEAITKRKAVYDHYHATLGDIDAITLPDYSNIEHHNYAYFPILINENAHLSRDELCAVMNADHIFPRKYFYPSITDFTPYKNFDSHCPHANDLASRVLCLPIYPDLTHDDIERIAKIINDSYR